MKSESEQARKLNKELALKRLDLLMLYAKVLNIFDLRLSGFLVSALLSELRTAHAHNDIC